MIVFRLNVCFVLQGEQQESHRIDIEANTPREVGKK
jgi:hypothetical protein